MRLLRRRKASLWLSIMFKVWHWRQSVNARSGSARQKRWSALTLILTWSSDVLCCGSRAVNMTLTP